MDGNDFFEPWEGDPVTSWSEAQIGIQQIIEKVGNRTMAWRGHVNAGWSLHSSLYRHLKVSSGIAPDEAKLLTRETAVIKYVRKRWRFDHLPALQLLAQLQHFRAPTRMLDVSLSPLVGLWFAVEEQFNEHDEEDGRLFSFDVSKKDRHVTLTPKWTGYELPWSNDSTDDKWCYELPMFWRPPAYNERIPAQQSGFLLAGVPKMKAGGNTQYRKAPGGSPSWRVNEIRQATSVPTRMTTRGRKIQLETEPTLTLRIKASAKPKIRHQLEEFYGMNSATLYPDAFGMAEEVRKAITQDVV